MMNERDENSSAPHMIHAKMFQGFLNDPNRFSTQWDTDHTCKPDCKNCRVAGPLRPSKVQEMGDLLKDSFATLHIDRFDFGKERSVVAILDNGRLVDIFRFHTVQDYQYDCNCHHHFSVLANNSGWFTSGSSPGPSAPFRFRTNVWLPECSNYSVFPHLYVAQSHYKQFHLFQNRLSPTEVAAVLMHAASSNARSIFKYVATVHEHLHANFDLPGVQRMFDCLTIHYGPMNQAETDELMEGYKGWGRELAEIQYPKQLIRPLFI